MSFHQGLHHPNFFIRKICTHFKRLIFSEFFFLLCSSALENSGLIEGSYLGVDLVLRANQLCLKERLTVHDHDIFEVRKVFICKKERKKKEKKKRNTYCTHNEFSRFLAQFQV